MLNIILNYGKLIFKSDIRFIKPIIGLNEKGFLYVGLIDMKEEEVMKKH